MDARRTLIADAALRVIAERGIRGLTHLAVDAEAALPKGSTSYYCRKRVDLLRLTVTRLFSLDRAEMLAAAAALTEGAPYSEAYVADALASVVAGWLTPPNRSRTIARLELFLAVAHDPELRDLNGEHLSAMVRLSLAVAAATDPAKSPKQVAASLMMADGLMMAVVRQNLPTPALDDISRLFRSILGGSTEVGGTEVPEMLRHDAEGVPAGPGDLTVHG